MRRDLGLHGCSHFFSVTRAFAPRIRWESPPPLPLFLALVSRRWICTLEWSFLLCAKRSVVLLPPQLCVEPLGVSLVRGVIPAGRGRTPYPPLPFLSSFPRAFPFHFFPSCCFYEKVEETNGLEGFTRLLTPLSAFFAGHTMFPTLFPLAVTVAHMDVPSKI